MDRFRIHILLAALLAAIVVIDAASARRDSLTYDEPTHFRYGQSILNLDSGRFIDGTMPFSALNALPQKISPMIPAGSLRRALSDVQTGRLATILFSALLGYFVFRWSRELYGAAGGLFSLMLFVFSPNIVAHARLITTDIYAAGMATITLYCFWRFSESGGWKLALASAIMLGLSQLAKYSCVFLYPILVMIVIARHWSELVGLGRAGDLKRLGARIGAFLKFAVVFAIVSAVVIQAGFLFRRPLVPLGDYEFKSDFFASAQSRLAFLKSVPVPLPYPYVQGFDWGKMREETGRGFGSMYLFGRLREVGGFKGYYFFALLFKEPIALQIIVVLAAVLYVLNRRRHSLLRNEVFLIVPVVFYAVYLNFFYNLQIGIRHFLVVLPFIHIFCGSLVGRWAELGKRIRWAVCLLAAYMVISVASYFPHYIPYFNELVWDRKQAYRILADSNVDWGQARGDAEAYAAAHPDVYMERGMWHMKTYRDKHMDEYLHPQFPDSGRILVNVNNFVGIYHPHRYQWLRDKYKPVGHVAYAYLLFDIPPGAAAGGSR